MTKIHQYVSSAIGSGGSFLNFIDTQKNEEVIKTGEITMTKLIRFIVFAAILGMYGISNAYTFDMGADSNVGGDAFSDPGLVMHAYINPALDSLTFDLDPGYSETFLFATFWTEETDVGVDDVIAQELTANVDFEMPELMSSVNGESIGFKGGF